MKKLLTIVVLVAFALAGCQKDTPPAPPTPPQEERVTIFGAAYQIEQAVYLSGHYRIVGLDALRFHIQLTNPASIVMEVSAAQVGKRVAIAPSDDFWFFAIGTGIPRGFMPFEYSDTNFRDYTGWFEADVDERTGRCRLDFELLKGGQTIASGHIDRVFERRWD